MIIQSLMLAVFPWNLWESVRLLTVIIFCVVSGKTRNHIDYLLSRLSLFSQLAECLYISRVLLLIRFDCSNLLK